MADHYLFPVFVEVTIHDSLQYLVASPFQAEKHVVLLATIGQGWLQSAVDRAICFKTSHMNEETGEVQVDETTLDPQKQEKVPDAELLVVPIPRHQARYLLRKTAVHVSNVPEIINICAT